MRKRNVNSMWHLLTHLLTHPLTHASMQATVYYMHDLVLWSCAMELCYGYMDGGEEHADVPLEISVCV